MKKKLLFLLISILILPSLVFAAAEFWVLDATDWIGQGQNVYKYRFNFQTVMNLADSFQHATYSQDHYNNEQYISAKNAIASVGVAGCNHKINYTVNTHGGTFVSQSDPSKYRSYYVVASPDYTVYGKSNGQTTYPRSYYRYNEITNQGVSEYTLLPSTEDGGTMTLRSPVTDGKTGSRVNTSNTTYKINAFGFDLFICMNPLQQSDLIHMSDKDDYIATITISWACNNNNCHEAHSGSFEIRVRGYFGTAEESEEDTFFMVVEPTPQSMSLDIKDLLLNDRIKKIADLSIDTTTRRMNNNSVYDWRSHLHVFLSASPDYNESGQRYLLWNLRNASTTVPFTITVENATNPSVSSTFDGTDSYPNSSNYLDLKDYTKSQSDNYYSSFTDRYQKNYYAINYKAEVSIDIQDKEVSINGTNVLVSTILRNPQTYASRYSAFVGNYQAFIYYHIVYTD